MAGPVVFLCPQCHQARQLAPFAVDARVRCLHCETSFRSDGFLFGTSDWPHLSDPRVLVAVASGMGFTVSARQWRLFACAFGRAAFDWCRNPWFRDALRIAERWADEGTAPRGVKLCRTELERITPPALLREYSEFGDEMAEWNGGVENLNYQLRQERERFAWVQLAVRCVNEEPRARREEVTKNNRPLAAAVLRDLVPNPFLSLEWKPDWFTSTVRDLARTIYDTREFTAMPILADAMQDAGCDDEQILTHCRANKPHARGCWVVDTILGKG